MKSPAIMMCLFALEKTLKKALLHPADVRLTKKHKLRYPDQTLDRQDLPYTMSQLKMFYPIGHPRFQISPYKQRLSLALFHR